MIEITVPVFKWVMLVSLLTTSGVTLLLIRKLGIYIWSTFEIKRAAIESPPDPYPGASNHKHKTRSFHQASNEGIYFLAEDTNTIRVFQEGEILPPDSSRLIPRKVTWVHLPHTDRILDILVYGDHQ